MDWTSIGDFNQPLLLFGRQLATELNVSVDAIEQSLLGVAVSAICRIFSRMAQRDGDSFERPTLSASIHRHGHRSAGAQCSKQKVIRTRARIGPSGLERFVGNKSVSPGDDFLGESRGTSAHNHIGFSDFFSLVLHRSRFAVSIRILKPRAHFDQPLKSPMLASRCHDKQDSAEFAELKKPSWGVPCWLSTIRREKVGLNMKSKTGVQAPGTKPHRGRIQRIISNRLSGLRKLKATKLLPLSLALLFLSQAPNLAQTPSQGGLTPRDPKIARIVAVVFVGIRVRFHLAPRSCIRFSFHTIHKDGEIGQCRVFGVAHTFGNT